MKFDIESVLKLASVWLNNTLWDLCLETLFYMTTVVRF